MLRTFLKLTEDDIQMNEMMLKQERAISEDASLSDLQQIYDPAFYDNRDAIKLEEKKKKRKGAKQEDDGEGGDGGDADMNQMADVPDQEGLDFGNDEGDSPPQQNEPIDQLNL